MPIFSETLRDEELIALVPQETQQVYIIGCGACENESLAYTHDLPITLKIEEEAQSPYATEVELIRIKKLLHDHDINAEIRFFHNIGSFVCMREKSRGGQEIVPNKRPDIVFTLCCDAGYNAIKELLPDLKVIKITRQTGFLFYTYSDKTGSRVIDKTKSGVIPRKKKNL